MINKAIYSSPLFRPPSEASNFILRVTLGCAHNGCAFCSMYKNVPFRVLEDRDILEQMELQANINPMIRRAFLADGDALVLPTERLLWIIEKMHEYFPKLKRISSYATPQDINRKSHAELRALHDKGLNLLYVGIESGSDEVLSFMNKGNTVEDIRHAALKAERCHIKLSVMIIIGLGGESMSDLHMKGTVDLLHQINPTYLSALTLIIDPQGGWADYIKSGSFTPSTEYQELLELKELLMHYAPKNPVIFRANHPSNLVPLEGILPKNKGELINTIAGLMDRAEKKIPNFNSMERY